MSDKEPTTPRKELVRQELLTKAAEVFERQGFAKTTIRDRADAIHLSRSALYRSFESKDEILDALVEGHAGSILTENIQLLRLRAAHSPLETLSAVSVQDILARMTVGAQFRALDQLTGKMLSE